ncbi:MAG: hypothetical protein AAGI48_02905 [Verrucomicrobiota bacterium]
MAEVLKHQAGLPSFTEILETISRWSERGNLNDGEVGQAKEQLGLCLDALKEKTDGMSGIVRGKVAALLESLDQGS